MTTSRDVEIPSSALIRTGQRLHRAAMGVYAVAMLGIGYFLGSEHLGGEHLNAEPGAPVWVLPASMALAALGAVLHSEASNQTNRAIEAVQQMEAPSQVQAQPQPE